MHTFDVIVRFKAELAIKSIRLSAYTREGAARSAIEKTFGPIRSEKPKCLSSPDTEAYGFYLFGPFACTVTLLKE